MPAFFKTAMLWLLLLVLPLQGFAAVTQSSCAAMMADRVHASVQSHRAAEHPQHQVNLHDEHALHDDAAQTDHQPNTHSDMKCSASAGCMSIAIFSVVPEITAFPLRSTVLMSTLSSQLPSHIPDGLKRPPRFFLV